MSGLVIVSSGSDGKLHCEVAPTSPWRAAEDDGFPQCCPESLLEHFEDIAVDPEDLLCDAVDLCIVLGASQGFLVFLDRENLIPSSGQCESNGISASPSKAIDDHRLLFWCCRDIVGNFSGDLVSWLQQTVERALKRSAARKRTYFATGSGVTPNHASSVIQIPSSYLEKISYL